MTEQSDVEVGGAGGTPNPSVSQTPVADADALSKLVKSAVDDALKPIKGEISGIYSRQDKDRNAFSEFMAEFKKQKAKGLDDDAAETAANSVLEKQKKEQKRDELLELVAKKLGLDSPSPVGNGNGGTVDMAKVVSDYGLKADDPDVIAAFGNRSFTDEKDARLATLEFAYKKATKPQPSDADKATSISAPLSTQLSVTDVNERIAKLNSYYKAPTKYAKEIAQLEKELDAHLPK